MRNKDSKLVLGVSQFHRKGLILPLAVLIVLINIAFADETKWIAVGNLHSWYSSAGSEREVGRTGMVSDQQDGLRWPAQYRWQDSQAAKALWIGATNYYDPVVDKTFEYKVVHVGPRVLDDIDEIMPVNLKMVGRFDHPSVYVDGVPGSAMMYGLDEVDEIDPSLPADRMIFNVVHTAIGITLTRKIYAFTNPYHSDYFIYDYVFKNTGIVKKDGSITHTQTLTDVVFFLQYRYAPTREGSVFGGGWLPQSASWGHNTVNDAIFTHPQTGDPFRVQFAWHGLHSRAPFNNIGGPYASGDGHLGAAQYVGVVTLHADMSATDKSDDPYQPFTTDYLQSDLPITSGNSQFNAEKMAEEYEAMTAGHPEKTHAEDVGCPTPIDCNSPADIYVKVGDPGNPGGYSQGHGFGPYTLEPGDSVHLVMAEAVDGLSRELCYTIGDKWLDGTPPFTLPDGSTTDDANYFKNAWVYTGQDSLFQTFDRAIANYNSGFDIPHPPPPPASFELTSDGDHIALAWSDNAEHDAINPVVGYRIYRAVHVPDTTYELLFECGEGTGNPIVHEFRDTTAATGFDYYYYIVSFDDGSTNDFQPGVPLESSMFWTKTAEPAFLGVDDPDQIRPNGFVLHPNYPNPFNVVTTLRYDIPERAHVTMKILDVLGREVETILDVHMDAGRHAIKWNASVVPSGVYFVRMESGGFSQIRKVMVLR